MDCSLELSKAQYWRNYKNEDCWVFGQETFYTFKIHLDLKEIELLCVGFERN